MIVFSKSANRFLSFLLAVICLTAVAAGAKEFRLPVERRAKAEKLTAVDLTWINGDCRVIPAETDEIVISAVKRLDALSAEDAQDLADHIQISALEIEGRLVVTTKYLQTLENLPGFWQKMLGKNSDAAFGKVDWTVSVPEGLEVVLTSTRGTISLEQLRNDIQVTSSAADINLTSIEGNIAVDNGSGKLQGNLLIGNLTIRQLQGSIGLEFVEGDIKIKSSSAAISVSQERGALDLTTTTGNVDIKTTLDSRRDYLVTTESGNIRVSVPQEASGRLKLNTRTGEIKTDMPVAITSMSSTRLDGVFGDGGVRIVLTSASGDLTVAQF